MILQSNPSDDNEQLLDEAIAEFLRAEAAGQVEDPQLWLERHPNCALGLAEFFDDRKRLARLVPSARSDRPASSGDEATGFSDSSHFEPPSETIDLIPNALHLATTRYRPLRFHARGGMGEVWLALDQRIGRHVAIKRLLPGRKRRQARFTVEAQVTGQLQHPGMVPLHDLGFDDAGQPFYVMKFINGRKFSDAIADFHSLKLKTDWSRDLRFRHLLEALVAVCNVVAYAHSKLVLHRDIKPDNVMLGPYGETLVVDWGLAKVIGEPEDLGRSAVRLSGGASSATQHGAIVGTPLYMSPEGAEGGAEAVDQSSDVYLLGATLYEILTATPPRRGSSQWELIDLARRSRPTNPRQLEPRIPRALEATCLKAMAFRKEDRYDSPLALADDIQRFLAGEPTAAYREPFLERCARWLRRHRRGVLRGLAIVFIVILGSAAATSYRQARWLADRERARERLIQFRHLADEAQYFAANSDAVSERVPYFDPHRALAAGEAALAIAAPWGRQGSDLPLIEEQAEFQRGKSMLLLLLARVELMAKQNEAAQRALSLLDEAAAIQQPTRGYYQLLSECLTRVGDRRAGEQEDSRGKAATVTATAEDHFLQGELFRIQDAGAAANFLGNDAPPNRDHLTKAIDEYRQALLLDPRHYWARFQFGRCLLALDRDAEAAEALGACIVLRPTSPWAYTARGLASARLGHAAEARNDLDRAIQLDPGFQPARLTRGIAEWLAGNIAAARADFDDCLALPGDKRLIEAAFYRGQLSLKVGRHREALADFSLIINERPGFRPAYRLRAQAEFILGIDAAAEADVNQFVALAGHDETRAGARLRQGAALHLMAMDLNGAAKVNALTRAGDELRAAISSGARTAEVFRHLGAVCELQGNSQDAIHAYSQGLTLAENKVPLLNLRGWAYVGQGKAQYTQARDDFSEAIRIEADNPESHAGLGFVLAQLADVDQARDEATASILFGSDNYLVLHNVACVYGRLSDLNPHDKLEFENLALAALQRAVKLSRQQTGGPDEITLIRQESAFPSALQSRPEFKRLLVEQPTGGR
jgi:serine/threonine protein kinase/Tfp pilus assembly protein PilF